MATVDTEIRFNKFNSLRMEKNEVSWSAKFEVEFYSTLTVQAQVLCLDGSATGQFILRWLDEDGKKLSDDTDGFDIENRWRRRTATFEVPEGAVQCMFALENTDGINAIHVACAMAEAGEIASAFDPSLATQTALLDAHGLYVGTVSAYQVIAGILQSLDMRAYFDLEKPEIVMKGDDAVWRASPKNPLRLEDTDGNFLGGLVKSGNKVILVSRGLATSDDPMYIIQIGDIDDDYGYTGAGLMTYKADNLQNPISRIETGLFENEGQFGVWIDGVALLMDAQWRDFGISCQDGNKWAVLSADPYEASFGVQGANTSTGFYSDADKTSIEYLGAQWHGLGVDSGGPYRVKNGSKTYF